MALGAGMRARSTRPARGTATSQVGRSGAVRASTALVVRAGLGAVPWDVLHQGLSCTLGLGIGTWSIIVGALVLVAWIPLRQRAGPGTLANVVLVGLALNGVATGAAPGPAPRPRPSRPPVSTVTT